jgi:hypothetical protein
MPPSISQDVLVTARIVGTAADALQVWLFGSRARSEATGTSDIDLLVIVPDDVDPKGAGQAGYRALGVHPVPVDLVVLRRADFDQVGRVPGSVAERAGREGCVVYERAA